MPACMHTHGLSITLNCNVAGAGAINTHRPYSSVRSYGGRLERGQGQTGRRTEEVLIENQKRLVG